MAEFDGDSLVFSSGNRFYFPFKAVGLSPDLWLSGGLDQGYGTPTSEDWGIDDKLPPEDMRELADYMISLWQQFKEAIPDG